MRRALVVLVALLAAGGAAYAAVRDTTPDPQQQAVADGCRRSKVDIIKGLGPNWVYVNDRDAPATGPPPPAQWAFGVVAGGEEGARISSGDDPLTHTSYDFSLDVRPDPQYLFLLGTNRSEASGTLHAERESGALPMWAWPDRGDRVGLLGSWVWDCDHWEGTGEETELHPYRALWVERDPSPRSPAGESEGDVYASTVGTVAGDQAECAHQLKGDYADKLRACVQNGSNWLSIDGDYHFQLSPPPRPSRTAQLVVRVVDRGSLDAPPVNAVYNDAGVQVSFSVHAQPGRPVTVAKQVFAGWREAPRPVHLRVRFDRLLVRRSMDGPGPPETTLTGQVVKPPGEFQLYWDVAGIWGRWQPGTVYARDGQSFPGRQTVDLYVPKGKPWRLFALARECDFGPLPNGRGKIGPLWPCPRTDEVGNFTGDDYPGYAVAHFGSPAASIGTHAVDASLAGSTCPASNRHGCYRLTFTVTRAR